MWFIAIAITCPQLRIADKWGCTNYWQKLIDVNSAYVRLQPTQQLHIADNSAITNSW